MSLYRNASVSFRVGCLLWRVTLLEKNVRKRTKEIFFVGLRKIITHFSQTDYEYAREVEVSGWFSARSCISYVRQCLYVRRVALQ